ncbi:hypothetical protein B0O99DRAFT_683260 [Bisporella sp. PMI_857]|nr:hypothetical protein B0O99DRAFT_683260 [Bisporella sp. PMI_857]
MNWTGGRLFRGTRKQGDLTARQREHFAKAKTGHRTSEQRKNPRGWIVFGNPAESGRSHVSRSISREDTHRGEKGISFFPQPSPKFSMRNKSAIRHSRKSDSYQPTDDRFKLKSEPVPTLQDDLYDATPEPMDRKRLRNPSMAGQKALNICQETTFEKRRRLLNKEDWVGIAMQRPVNFQFPSTYGDQIGRRRTVTDRRRARYSSKSNIQLPAFMTNTKPYSPCQTDTLNRLPMQRKHDVRIAIGDRVVQTGIGSSSANSQRQRSSSHTQLLSSYVSSSDVMLLDSQGDPLRSPYMWNNRKSSTGDSAIAEKGTYALEEKLATPYLGRPMSKRSILEAEKGLFSRRLSIIGNSVRGSNNLLAELDQDGIHSNGDIRFLTSPVSVQHPKPQSLRVFSLLHSSPTELADSIAVQIGRQKPVVPNSQILDNEIWETWIGDLSGEGHTQDDNDDQFYQSNISISPGISAEYRQFSWVETHSPARAPLSQSKVISLIDEEIGDLHSEGDDSTHRILYDHHELAKQKYTKSREQAKYRNDGIKGESTVELNCSTKATPQSQTVINTRESMSKTTAVKESTPDPSPDPEEVWRKFVFSDSDDESIRSNSHCRHDLSVICVKKTMHSSSSIYANPSITETPRSESQSMSS